CRRRARARGRCARSRESRCARPRSGSGSAALLEAVGEAPELRHELLRRIVALVVPLRALLALRHVPLPAPPGARGAYRRSRGSKSAPVPPHLAERPHPLTGRRPSRWRRSAAGGSSMTRSGPLVRMARGARGSALVTALAVALAAGLTGAAPAGASLL